jgi:RND family efflux transporter MFP subunit
MAITANFIRGEERMQKKPVSPVGWGVVILLFGLVLSPTICFPGQTAVPAINPGVVTARSRTITTHLSAYGRVEPIAILKATQTGAIDGFTVLPGESVDTGTDLGRLTGPVVDALMARYRRLAADAGAGLTAAEDILAGERRKQAAHLATQERVHQAEADVAKARADVENARSRLRVAQESVVLKAPAGGIVLTVDAANGEQVQPGQTILTLQPAGGLWLTAQFYGSDASAVRIGMTGTFDPAAGGAAVPVKVRTVIGPVGTDGGLTVGLIATVPAPHWLNGDAGRVILPGAVLTGVAVPTRALILNDGRWWVLERTKHGDRRREVVPGPSWGTLTLIEKGLEPDIQVVVENAYLEFHRDFSRQYQPPD